MSKPVVAIYTSTRADYGLVRPLIGKLIASNKYEVRIFATGTHFSEKFGMTINEIEADYKDSIFYRVEHYLEEQEPLKSVPIMSDALIKYSQALTASRPDLAVVLGDRYEALCFALSCATLGIKLAHLHGGELSYGAIDDKYRHCITKLSEFHFVACEKYRKRVVQLGEDPSTVFNVGALGVDNALNLKLPSTEEVKKKLNVELNSDFYILTLHPETSSSDYGIEIFKAFLNKILDYIKDKNISVLVTGVNNDNGSNEVKNLLDQFCKLSPTKVHYFNSLGVLNFLTLVKQATAVMGNSSSGILEAHILRTPALNIGLRQEGRERESSVFDLPSTKEVAAFDLGQLAEKKQALLADAKHASIFGDGKASDLIVQKLESLFDNKNKSESANFKKFFDVIGG